MKLKKELGQNFLINNYDIQAFINFCDLKKQDIVLELGPGNGALTKLISPKVSRIIAIELDLKMTLFLNNLKIKNLIIENCDFLDLNLREVITTNSVTKIIGAIPYYISSPIIHKVIKEATTPLEETCLITQKEFALKLIGKKPLHTNKKNQLPSRSYFTNLVEKYAQITQGAFIDKTSFNPIPKVDSMYFKLKHTNYPLNSNEVEHWSKFLHHVFKTPRKKINKRFSKKMLHSMDINENIRPENLSGKQLENLYNKTSTYRLKRLIL